MRVGLVAQLFVPPIKALHQFAQRVAAFAFDQPRLNTQARALNKVHTIAARGHLDGLHRFIAKSAFGRVDDAFKREVIIMSPFYSDQSDQAHGCPAA